MDSLFVIGERIRNCRKENKMTQASLAEILDTTVNTISAIENGVQQFSLDKLATLAETFKVTTDYILTGEVKQRIEDELINEILSLPILEKKKLLASLRICKQIAASHINTE